MIREAPYTSARDGKHYALFFDADKGRVRGACPDAARTGHRREISVNLRDFPDFFERKRNNVYHHLAPEVQVPLRHHFPVSGVRARHRMAGTQDLLKLTPRGLVRETPFGALPANPADYAVDLAPYRGLWPVPENRPLSRHANASTKRDRSVDSRDRLSMASKKPRLLSRMGNFRTPSRASGRSNFSRGSNLGSQLKRRFSHSVVRLSSQVGLGNLFSERSREEASMATSSDRSRSSVEAEISKS